MSLESLVTNMAILIRRDGGKSTKLGAEFSICCLFFTGMKNEREEFPEIHAAILSREIFCPPGVRMSRNAFQKIQTNNSLYIFSQKSPVETIWGWFCSWQSGQLGQFAYIANNNNREKFAFWISNVVKCRAIIDDAWICNSRKCSADYAKFWFLRTSSIANKKSRFSPKLTLFL